MSEHATKETLPPAHARAIRETPDGGTVAGQLGIALYPGGQFLHPVYQ